ncbi:hypothetical protein [Flavobacterium sp.]|uniref:hypothetical protein n=1 Tax=Flavobacterium sp. TaxID=239 RepID=UPI0025E3193E|nr:hypothetical protein [Flavobacterium sp.]
MVRKIYFNWLLVLASFVTHGQEVKAVIFENEKIKVTFHNGAFEQKINYEKFDIEKYDTIFTRIFRNKKTFLGKEINRNLNFKDLEKKYLKKAFELENKVFHDIKLEKENFKIVHEVLNNEVCFYYYYSGVYNYKVLRYQKTKKKRDFDSWMYYGNKPFWFELIINGRVVAWKKCH